MSPEYIVGSIITESGPQPFVMYTETGKFDVGNYVKPDEAQQSLSVIQQQRFIQLIAERAGLPFAQVRLGQYRCSACGQWVEATPGQWSISVCMSCSLDRASELNERYQEEEQAAAEASAAEASAAAPVAEAEPTEAPPAPAAPEEEPTEEEKQPEAIASEPPAEEVAPEEVVREEIALEPPPEDDAPEEVELKDIGLEPPAEEVVFEADTPGEVVLEEIELEPPPEAEAPEEVAMEEIELEPPAEAEAPEEAAPELEVSEEIELEEIELEAEAPEEIVLEDEAPEESVLEDEASEEAAPEPALSEPAAPAETFIDVVLSPDDAMMLEKAIHLAVEAHSGQRDKAGDPYILHPLRMMLTLDTPAEKMVAVLHDVVEDTPWTLDGLRSQGFSEEIVEAVACLTKQDGESYEDFIERAAGHSIARRVKLADLEDNMDVRRLDTVTNEDQERFARYLKAWRRLKGF